METKEALTCSPVETNASNSLLLGSVPKDLAKSIKRFVSPLIAETTTTGEASLHAVLIKSATADILSVDPTDVPPNFNTIVSIVNAQILSDGLYDIRNRINKYFKIISCTCSLSKILSASTFSI